jgi:toxin ParE1/3/4
MRLLIFAPEAVSDARQAYLYYEGQRPGLGEDFLRSVDARIQLLHRSPEMFAVEYLDYRRVLLRRFPYAVVYHCDDKTITVYGIFHAAADPEKWKSRVAT